MRRQGYELCSEILSHGLFGSSGLVGGGTVICHVGRLCCSKVMYGNPGCAYSGTVRNDWTERLGGPIARDGLEERRGWTAACRVRAPTRRAGELSAVRTRWTEWTARRIAERTAPAGTKSSNGRRRCLARVQRFAGQQAAALGCARDTEDLMRGQARHGNAGGRQYMDHVALCRISTEDSRRMVIERRAHSTGAN